MGLDKELIIPCKYLIDNPEEKYIGNLFEHRELDLYKYGLNLELELSGNKPWKDWTKMSPAKLFVSCAKSDTCSNYIEVNGNRYCLDFRIYQED